MLKKQTIKDVKIRDQIVLVRADYNVPMKDGIITDDLRIRASFPTIEYLLENGAKSVVLMSHLGRPEGQKVPELSLRPIAERLKELMPGKHIEFVSDVSGPDVEMAVEGLPKGGILLLENLRFYPGEEKDSADFAAEIAESTHANLFVQDGFAVVHRAHASTSAITKDLHSVAGLLLEKEVNALTAVSENPEHPFYVVIGGAKVDDKQPLIEKFLPIADKIIVGGKIAADGYTAPDEKIYVAEDFSDEKKFDIGEVSTSKILDMVSGAKTVLWNGVLGFVEESGYEKSSTALAEALGNNPSINSVICGGDTAGFAENLQKQNPSLKYTLISTGGGAALELLSGLELPGVESLSE